MPSQAWRDNNRERIRELNRRYDWHRRDPEAHRLAMARYMQRRYDELERRKQAGCADCGETDLDVLEFDHVPERGPKLFSPTQVRISWEKFITELDKCDVVCANDHSRRTKRRLREASE